MKAYLAIWIVLTLTVNKEAISGLGETTITPVHCANGTEDSCEGYNDTESSPTLSPEEATNVFEQTKKPQTSTTLKPTTKKSFGTSNATVSLKADPDCTCDILRGGCDVDCCCDVDCSSDQRAVFTHCISLAPPLDTDHCVPPNTIYHNNTDLMSAPTESGMLCVVQHNIVLSTDFTDVPIIKSIAAFEKKLGKQKYFSWNNPVPLKPVFDTDSSYTAQSPVWVTDNVTVFHFELPSAVGTSTLCRGKVVPKYLSDSETSCTVPLSTHWDCLKSREVDISFISTPRSFNFTQVQECTEDVCLPVRKFVCTTMCTEGKVPMPSFNKTSKTCLNFVESVEYQINHNGTQGILEVNTFYKVRNISTNATNQLRRKFYKVTYKWAGSPDKPLLKRSGHPGYESGKPIISGKQTLKKVMYNVTKENWINVGTAGVSGFCEKRYNLAFKENIMTQCSLVVKGTCREIQQQIWEQLLQPSTNLSEVMISSFGDPQENNVNMWVPLLVADLPPLPMLTTSIDIVIVYSLVGALSLPQAKIIGVYLRPVPLGVTCSSNLGSVTLRTTVRFIDNTKPAVTKFAQPPVYEIKLPQNFFYPFFSSGAKYSVSKCVIFFMFLFYCNL